MKNHKYRMRQMQKIAVISMISVWFLDFLSTLYFLYFCENLTEGNPIARYFFSLGFGGYILSTLFTLMVLMVSVVIINTLCPFLLRIVEKRKMLHNEKILINVVFAGLFIALEISVVIRNITMVILYG